MYADNGKTRTVFDRPEFNRLMTDIKSGRIKCLVVRDLSCFGRDYIETGTYLERIFPQIGLRFISIKEHDDEQFADLSRYLDEAVQRKTKFTEAMSVDNKWITLMKSVSCVTKLTQELVDESVELVKIHDGGAVELVMKYGDIYTLILQSTDSESIFKIVSFNRSFILELGSKHISSNFSISGLMVSSFGSQS